MSDANKSDSDRAVPPQRAEQPATAQSGETAWLDGLDLPAGDSPASKPESWPELIPLGKAPVSRPPSDPVPTPVWSEPDSWPDMPQSPSPNPLANSSPAAEVQVHATEAIAPPRAEPITQTPASPPGPYRVMEGVTVLRDDFAGMSRLRTSVGLPPQDPPPQQAAPPPSVTPQPPATAADDMDLPVVKVESGPVLSSGRNLSVTYGMTVDNTTAGLLYQVRVEHDLPPGPRFLTADPAPDVHGAMLVWNLGTLEPGSKRDIQVTVQPNFPGEIADDAVSLFRVFQCVHVVTGIVNSAGGVNHPRRVAQTTAPPLSHPIDQDQFLAFTVADSDFAVPIRNVVEISRPETVTQRPGLPNWVLGVTKLRGEAIALVGLGRIFGLLGDLGPRARVLVARSGDAVAGLVVDRVGGVRVLSRRNQVPIVPDRVRPFVTDVADDNGRPLLLLDVDRLLHAPDLQFKPE